MESDFFPPVYCFIKDLILKPLPGFQCFIVSNLTVCTCCSSSVSLKGRWCRKLVDQIVTMTGKQPGWYHFTMYTGRLPAHTLIPVPADMFLSNDCLIGLSVGKRKKKNRQHRKDCSKTVSPHQTAFYFLFGWKLRHSWSEKNNLSVWTEMGLSVQDINTCHISAVKDIF